MVACNLLSAACRLKIDTLDMESLSNMFALASFASLFEGGAELARRKEFAYASDYRYLASVQP